MVMNEPLFTFVRGIDRVLNGDDVGEVIGIGSIGVTFSNSIEDVLFGDRPDVLVDLTEPTAAKRHVRLALEDRRPPSRRDVRLDEGGHCAIGRAGPRAESRRCHRAQLRHWGRAHDGIREGSSQVFAPCGNC